MPERRRFGGQPLSPAIGAALARGDRTADGEPGERAQLLRHFDILPRGWPMAALTRESEAGDAADDGWLRADPVFVQPDMAGVRLMAWGNLGLAPGETAELLQPLRPLFGDAGLPLTATTAEHWYLQLQHGAVLPDFIAPDEALGQDLLALLPQGAEGRRWRALLNEAQIILHNHPVNGRRVAAGLLPANSVWFWGGGQLPEQVRCRFAAVISLDPELQALARRAGTSPAPGDDGSTLLDLRRERDWARVEQDRLLPAIASLGQRYASLRLDFGDGASWCIARGQRWRLWRRASTGLADSGG